MRLLSCLGVLALHVTAIGCAGSPVPMEPAPAARPLVASLQPVSPPSTPPSPDIHVDRTASAAALLDQGIRLVGDNHFAAGAEAFGEAIATGRLNDAGRAFAYWQIYIANDELGNQDGCADALASFAVVAAEVLDQRRRLRFAVNAAGDFVDRFGLEPKLRRARAELSATWAGRAEHFGRTEDLPVPVHDLIEMEQFLHLAASCDDSTRQNRAQREVESASGERLRRVTITCAGYEELADFYFAVVDE